MGNIVIWLLNIECRMWSKAEREREQSRGVRRIPTVLAQLRLSFDFGKMSNCSLRAAVFIAGSSVSV